MEKKVDFVITWVDGSDQEWLIEKEKYRKGKTGIDCRINRYRDWETLKYWFRGVEKYAPWVNKVYFVTWGHIPNWLNVDNEKLVIVKHEDFIPKNYLPTFSSNPIEFNVFRIKQLSENFVLFNDDMFIIKPTKQNDFFKDDMPCDSAIFSPIISNGTDGFAKKIAANLSIINKYFDKMECIKKHWTNWFNCKYGKDLLKTICLMPWDKFVGFYDLHLPYSYKKSSFEKLWEIENDSIDRTCMNKFRNNNLDVSHWLVRYWQLCEGNFKPRSTKFGSYFEYSEDNTKLYSAIEKQKSKIVCLNDANVDANFEKAKKETIEAFDKILPNKCSFEL